MIAFIRHLQGFLGIKFVIRQFLASKDLIVDMIFEWPKNTEKTERYRKFRIWDCFFSGFLLGWVRVRVLNLPNSTI